MVPKAMPEYCLQEGQLVVSMGHPDAGGNPCPGKARSGYNPSVHHRLPDLMPPSSPIPSAQRITMVDAIEALLPQTQCGKCKHPGCRPYAEAIARGEGINHCVPGGQDTIDALGILLGEAPLPLDPAFGATPATRQVAVIRESECIGCTKCIQACPVDAIVGAAKFTHTIIRSECTGCDLCIAPCPVDCIDLVNLTEPLLTKPQERQQQAQHQKARYEFRNMRLERERAARNARTETPLAPTQKSASSSNNDSKNAVIAAALLRSNLKKAEKRLAAAHDEGADCTLLEREVRELRKALNDLAS